MLGTTQAWLQLLLPSSMFLSRQEVGTVDAVRMCSGHWVRWLMQKPFVNSKKSDCGKGVSVTVKIAHISHASCLTSTVLVFSAYINPSHLRHREVK